MKSHAKFANPEALSRHLALSGARSRIKRSFALLATGGLTLLLLAGCRQSSADGSALSDSNQAVSNMQSAEQGENANAVAARKSPIFYIAFGDSTGVGVGARSGGGYVARIFKRIEQARAGSQLKNYCVSGATSADVLRQQLDAGLKNKPTLVTLGIGVNDVGRGVGADEFARNYAEIIKRIRAKTDAPIVVSNLPDISFAPRVPEFLRSEAQYRIQLFNMKIAEIAARENIRVVDLYTPTHELLATRREFFSEDGFHPSDAGYEQWTEIMWPTVQQVLP